MNHWMWAKIASLVLAVLCGGIYAYSGYLERRIERERVKMEFLEANLRRMRRELKEIKEALAHAEGLDNLEVPAVPPSFVESLEKRLREKGVQVKRESVMDYSVLNISASSGEALRAIPGSWDNLKKGLIEPDHYTEGSSGINIGFKVFFRVRK